MKQHTSSTVLLLLPGLLLFVFTVILPIIQGLGVAFTNWNGFDPNPQYIGFRNFRILFTDPDILLPIRNTLMFTVMTVISINLLGLVLALGVFYCGKIQDFFRSLFLLPLVISLVLASYIWSYIFSDVLPAFFGIRGLLGNRSTVMIGISIIALWRDAGLAMLIYIAGLISIPEELYEAALIDGAKFTQTLQKITLPMLAPAFTICITLWLGWGLRVFDYPMVATGGGPGRSSETLAMYVYNYTFPFARAGYGQAAALMLFLFVFLISGTVARILRQREITL